MSQGRRWAQYEEDADRLPEGLNRVGYDADTQRYTFQDTLSPNGVLYRGEPGMEYGGMMIPIGKPDVQEELVRPEAFASTSRTRARSSTLPAPTTAPKNGDVPPPRTFAEILPPELITTSSLSDGAAPRSSSHFSSSLSSKTSTRQNETQIPSKQRLVEAVRRSALPKMQGVVSDLRRSVTSRRRDKNKPSSARFNIAPKRGASGLSAGTYTRFSDEVDDELELGKVEEENHKI